MSPRGFRAGVAALVGLAAALRIPWLEGVPNPAHDEGNWLLLAWRRWRGEDASLAGDQAFVTTLYARLIVGVWRVLGVSVAHARLVQVLALLATMVWGARWFQRRGEAPMGLAFAALLAVHPWTLAWSRVAVAPYVLSLACATLAPMAVVRAWRDVRWWPRALAAQLVALGFQWSPLAAIPAAACALWIVWDARTTLRDGRTWLAAALAGLHIAPVVQGALRVSATGATRPSSYTDHLSDRVANYAGTLVDVLSGEATVRDFSDAWLHGAAWWASVLVALAALVCALRRGRLEGPLRDLHTLSVMHLAAAVPGIALMLAPMRQWHMPSVDAERYGFALLAPVVTLVAMGARSLWGRRAVMALVAALALSPTLRMTRTFVVGGGADHGVYRAQGGGAQRRWKVLDTHVPVAEAVLRAADRIDARGIVVAVPDYQFHPIHFFNRARRHRVVDASYATVPLSAGSTVLVATWAPGVFVAGYEPAAMVRANEALRALLRDARVETVVLWETLRAPGGGALVELWRVTVRR